MLYYDRIDVSEGIDVNKIDAWKECNICHTWYFLDKGFLLNLSDIAILNIHSVDFCSIINGISKIKAVNLKTKKLIQTKKLELYKT